MKKRVAIFTMPFRFGYGGIMQAYALQTVIERLGYDVSLVQTFQGNQSLPHGLIVPLVYVKRALFKLLGLSNIPVFAEKKYNEEWQIITAQVHQFVRDRIHLKEVNSFADLKEGDYDILVVGSDQVWRKAYCDVTRYFLRFAENWNVERIAYAASFGTAEKEYTNELLSICRPLALKFDAISVREDSGIRLCNDYFGINAHHVLDPTMLLRGEDYEKLTNDRLTMPSEGDLFSYILDEELWKKDTVKSVANELRLTPFSIKVCGDNHQLNIVDRIQPSVEQWLRAFMDAKFIVTDSFHGCVFAILFHKPFIVLSNNERGNTRIDSLLKMFSLENRMTMEGKGINSIINSQIDWNLIDNLLNTLRQKSQDFLNKSL